VIVNNAKKLKKYTYFGYMTKDQDITVLPYPGNYGLFEYSKTNRNAIFTVEPFDFETAEDPEEYAKKYVQLNVEAQADYYMETHPDGVQIDPWTGKLIW
jgi:hypothetical protein